MHKVHVCDISFENDWWGVDTPQPIRVRFQNVCTNKVVCVASNNISKGFRFDTRTPRSFELVDHRNSGLSVLLLLFDLHLCSFVRACFPRTSVLISRPSSLSCRGRATQLGVKLETLLSSALLMFILLYLYWLSQCPASAGTLEWFCCVIFRKSDIYGFRCFLVTSTKSIAWSQTRQIWVNTLQYTTKIQFGNTFSSLPETFCRGRDESWIEGAASKAASSRSRFAPAGGIRNGSGRGGVYIKIQLLSTTPRNDDRSRKGLPSYTTTPPLHIRSFSLFISSLTFAHSPLICKPSLIVILKGPISSAHKLLFPGRVPFWKNAVIFALPHLFNGPSVVYYPHVRLVELESESERMRIEDLDWGWLELRTTGIGDEAKQNEMGNLHLHRR